MKSIYPVDTNNIFAYIRVQKILQIRKYIDFLKILASHESNRLFYFIVIFVVMNECRF